MFASLLSDCGFRLNWKPKFGSRFSLASMSRAQLFDRSTAMNFVPPLKPGLSGGDSADFVANQLRSSLGHIIAAESQLCFGNFTLAAERLRHADANIRSARQYSASH